MTETPAKRGSDDSGDRPRRDDGRSNSQGRSGGAPRGDRPSGGDRTQRNDRPARDGERKPWSKDGARTPRDGERKPWTRDGAPQRDSGARPPRDGERKPWSKDAGSRPSRDGDRPNSGARPARDGERKPWSKDGAPSRDGARPPRSDDRSSYNARPARDGERKPWSKDGGSQRDGGARPARDGDRPSYNSRPQRDGDRPSSNSRPARDGDRPSYNSRPARDGDRPSYNSRPVRDGDRPSYNSRPQRDGDRPSSNSRPARDGDRPSYNSRPARDGDRPSYNSRPARDGDRPSYNSRPARDGDRPNSGSRPPRDGERKLWTREGAPARGDRDAQWEDELTDEQKQAIALRPVRAHHDDPDLPYDVSDKDLDRLARNELKTLTKDNAEWVAKHLAMAARLIDSDPVEAHRHVTSAARRAGRIAMVRETLAITAYATGDYALALRELRTYRRISGKNDQLPLMVDSERAVGRADRALELGRSVERSTLPAAVQVALAIAMSGARLDLGQADAALVELEIEQLDPTTAFSYSSELFAAYAEVLEELGRDDEASEWRDRAELADEALGDDEGDTIDVFELEDDEDDAAAFDVEDEDEEPGEQAADTDTDADTDAVADEAVADEATADESAPEAEEAGVAASTDEEA